MRDIFCQYESTFKEDSLYQTDNFWVKIGFGLIAPGQVMLIPRAHYDCLADLPQHLEQEFLDLKQEITEKVSAAFSSPFLIEYGNCGTVQHAHIHFIPKKSEDFLITDVLGEMVISRVVPHQLMDPKTFRENYVAGSRYIFVEDNGVSCVLPQDSLRINYNHREYFSKVLGLPAAHSWSKLTLEEKMIDERKREITKKTLAF